MILYSFLVLILTSSVLCDGVDFLESCWSYDMDCLSRSTEKFLRKTANGVPETDFKPIDPLIIPSLDIKVDDHIGLVFHFKELNVTGLKEQTISDFCMDKAAKSVVLTTKADLNVAGLVTIELTKDSKSFTGLSTIDATVLGTASYNYNLIPDNEGVEFFQVEPETISSEVIGDPNFVLGSNTQGLLETDLDAKTWNVEDLVNRSALKKKIICHITNLIYVDVVHNIRTAAKLFPKTAFFKDV